jgi:Spy/CpxP family protein refolding chaperone
MKRTLLTLASVMVLVVVAATGVFAQGAATSAAATPPTAEAQPSTSAPPSVARPRTPRPVPSILPTLRLIHSEMLPTLGFLLTLTDDQKTKALDLLNKSDEESKPKVTAQTKAAADYIALLGKENSTLADLTAAAQKVLAADNDLMADRIKAFVAFKGLLTPEQNKRLAQELEQTARRWLPQVAAPAGPTPTPATGK